MGFEPLSVDSEPGTITALHSCNMQKVSVMDYLTHFQSIEAKVLVEGSMFHEKVRKRIRLSVP